MDEFKGVLNPDLPTEQHYPCPNQSRPSQKDWEIARNQDAFQLLTEIELLTK